MHFLSLSDKNIASYFYGNRHSGVSLSGRPVALLLSLNMSDHAPLICQLAPARWFFVLLHLSPPRYTPLISTTTQIQTSKKKQQLMLHPLCCKYVKNNIGSILIDIWERLRLLTWHARWFVTQNHQRSHP